MRLRALGFAAAAALLATLVLNASFDSGTAKALTYSQLTAMQKRLLSGLAELEFNPDRAAAPAALRLGLSFFPRGDDACAESARGNVKVNQNCVNISDPDLQGRGQAQNETSVAQDPTHPQHIIVTANDYRRGDANCFGYFSLDGGRTWNDAGPPTSFTRAQPTFSKADARQYWGGGGDTSVAWDTRGNAYFACQLFNRGEPVSTNPDQSSSFYVFRSTQNNGASWNFPGRQVAANADLTGAHGGLPFEDKAYLTVDNHVGSPFQDRVYVTWTEFAADGSAYIWESFSSDFGETFSPRHLVSQSSRLCVNTFGAGTPHGTCNINQFSQPFTAPDGTLYVVWDTFNTATGHRLDEGDDEGGGGDVGDAGVGTDATAAANPKDNRNQVLLAISRNGGASFGAPIKVADFYDLPDCATYQNGQDAGSACVPEKGKATNSVFRAANYPVGGVNPADPTQVVVSVASYIGPNSNESNGCVPTGHTADTLLPTYDGVKTPGACNNDILLSVSNNGGQTFTGRRTDPRHLPSVTNAPRQRTTDQWFQWLAFSRSGRLAISYYDRQFGDDETTGNSDFSISGATADDIRKGEFGVRRVTSSSMPLPTQFPDPEGNSTFWGDYTGLAVTDNQALPAWSDTRNQSVLICPGTAEHGAPPGLCMARTSSGITLNDQDIFFDRVDIPSS